ncbi:MAG: retroviral-like aspartic protease family protein [Candidatus Saccharimonadales bacterium]
MSKLLPPTGGALTATHNGRARELHSDVSVRSAIQTVDQVQFDGIWDTGATNTVITQVVVDRLKLPQTGVKEVHTPQGSHTTPSYIVDLLFPGTDLEFNGLEVTLGTLPNCQVLIGMDVIGFGDFSVTNKDGLTVMSFRAPSKQRIDYVEQVNREKIKFSLLSKTKQRKFMSGK